MTRHRHEVCRAISGEVTAPGQEIVQRISPPKTTTYVFYSKAFIISASSNYQKLLIQCTHNAHRAGERVGNGGPHLRAGLTPHVG